MILKPLPAFSDNYIWLLHNGKSALVVDPGDASPVFEALDRLGLQLETILVTHHHADHVGGVTALREATGAVVYGPAFEVIPEPVKRLSEGDTVEALGLQFQVVDVPGHTAGHIAYYCNSVAVDADAEDTPSQQLPLLFCGDTLFSGGCGRLFEGTAAQMLISLNKLAAFPGNTQVCCTHEYTLSNLRFAVAVEPTNEALLRYQTQCIALREQHRPTLPSNLAQELLINPFLRTQQSTVIQAACRFDTTLSATESEEANVFAAIREWKNKYQ